MKIKNETEPLAKQSPSNHIQQIIINVYKRRYVSNVLSPYVTLHALKKS